MNEFIKNLPKAELHVHFDGTLTPEHFLTLAERNKVKVPYSTIEEVQKAWSTNLPKTFYELYNITTLVLRKERDFYEVMQSYLERAVDQGVKHAEIFFDTQTYTARGIPAKSVINPLYEALQDAKIMHNITGGLILCFLRHLPEQHALQDLHDALPYKGKIIAVGLAANEVNNPPSKFARVFAQAKAHGFYLTAHAGERSGPESIRELIDILHVDRVDHGIRCMEDPGLVKQLLALHMPLTVCPLSNVALGVVPSLEAHPLKQMLTAGLSVSINSDDPSYFGGYIADNFEEVFDHGGLTIEDLVTCAENSFKGAFCSPELKEKYLKELREFVKKGI